jgi:hypothetical protein
MLRTALFATIVLLALTCALSVTAQTIPFVKAKALDDSEVTLPNPASQQILILIIGFSKKSGDVCQLWGKRINAELLQDPRVSYYQLPHLEGVPTLVKPMILHGMRKDLNAQQQSHLVPLYDHQEEWKRLVDFTAPDDAYLIVADAEGHVFWQAHGAYSDSTYAALKNAVFSLLSKSK